METDNIQTKGLIREFLTRANPRNRFFTFSVLLLLIFACLFVFYSKRNSLFSFTNLPNFKSGFYTFVSKERQDFKNKVLTATQLADNSAQTGDSAQLHFEFYSALGGERAKENVRLANIKPDKKTDLHTLLIKKEIIITEAKPKVHSLPKTKTVVRASDLEKELAQSLNQLAQKTSKKNKIVGLKKHKNSRVLLTRI